MERIRHFFRTRQIAVALLITVFLFVLTTLINPRSLNVNTAGSILALTSMLCLASAGQTLVILTGGIDMSTGDVMSITAILTVSILHSGLSSGIGMLAAFVTAVAVGAFIGFLNGLGVAAAGLPPMVVTLYIANVVDKLQYVFTNGTPTHTSVPNWYKQLITTRFFSVLPSILIVGALVFVFVFILLGRTRYARQLYLTGNNPRAAFLTGIRTRRLKIITYTIAGMLNGLAGLIGAGNTGNVDCGTFRDMTITTIVAVVVGGTLLVGGKGSFQGTMVGALLMIVLSNGLAVLQVSDSIRNLIMGIILIALLSLYNRERSVRL